MLFIIVLLPSCKITEYTKSSSTLIQGLFGDNCGSIIQLYPLKCIKSQIIFHHTLESLKLTKISLASLCQLFYEHRLKLLVKTLYTHIHHTLMNGIASIAI